jgi:hypothetical protein
MQRASYVDIGKKWTVSIVGSERIQKLREPNNHGYKVALNNQNWDLD